MAIQLVVFDIAGTTVKDKGNINEVFRKAFKNAGVDGVKVEDVDEVMGYKKMEAVKILLAKYKTGAEEDQAFVDFIHDDFSRQMVSYYETTDDLDSLPFAEDVFKELQSRQVKVALNTGFTREITRPILKRLGWDNAPFINEVVCSDEVPKGRPYPDMIKKIMEDLEIESADEVAKVGDTKVDMEEGFNASCGLVVGVTTGACSKEDLLTGHPDYIIDSLKNLPSLIL
jgi:phosphonatase-like hydrolase